MGHVTALLLLLVAACVDNTAMPGRPPGTRVSLRSKQAPALLAFRDEAADAWQVFTGATTVDVATTGPYRVAVACQPSATGRFAQVRELARTPDDGDTLELGCGGALAPFLVTGELPESTEVVLGQSITSTVRGTFEMQSAPGTFDLVMLTGDLFDGYSGVAIRRRIRVERNTYLGKLDLAHEGQVATMATIFGATNLINGEQLSVRGTLDTGTTQASLALGVLDHPTTVPLVPDSALRETDHQRVQVLAFGPTAGGLTSTRGAVRDVHLGDDTAFTLPEPLGPVTFDLAAYRMSATWSALPAYATLEVRRESSAARRTRVHVLTLTRSFLEATGATTATLDLRDVPGILEDWQLDPTGAPYYSLFAVADATSVGISGPPATTGSR